MPITILFVGLGLAIAHKCGARRRELIAIAIGLLVASIVPVLIIGISSLFDGDYKPGDPIVVPLVIFFAFSSLFVIVLGMPTFLVLRPFRPGHWWSVAAAGMLLGVIPDALVQSGIPNVNAMVPLSIFGGASALGFWVVWRREAPPPRHRSA